MRSGHSGQVRGVKIGTPCERRRSWSVPHFASIGPSPCRNGGPSDVTRTWLPEEYRARREGPHLCLSGLEETKVGVYRKKFRDMVMDRGPRSRPAELTDPSERTLDVDTLVGVWTKYFETRPFSEKDHWLLVVGRVPPPSSSPSLTGPPPTLSPSVCLRSDVHLSHVSLL